ncbi:MAG: L-histidine N(alpha)-methyltransferase [Rhodospirillales bacterium]|nr:L-histidine N(alpha)-methyltransferase [Rhodospirillales bacterium]
MTPPIKLGALHDFHDYEHTGDEEFLDAVLSGLSKPEKKLPCKFFYDETGSQLFDRICELEEYYPTRTELALLNDKVHEIAEFVPPGSVLVEFGSGSSVKVRILLESVPGLDTYVPIDISREHLMTSAQALADDFKDYVVVPLCADFTKHFDPPDSMPTGTMMMGFFPGSTIGNFTPAEAVRFLGWKAEFLGSGGTLLIGVDLKKDEKILHAAYNDRAGVTAAFNLNLLTRINRELGGDFDTESFEHEAVYDPDKGCVDLYLVSTRLQAAQVDGTRFVFEQGERIHTESSYKYHMDEFQTLAHNAGFTSLKSWSDEKDLFSIHLLKVN